MPKKKRKRKRTRKRVRMPEKIDLPDGGWAEINTSLTGADQKWWNAEVARLEQANGSARPAYTAPDPDNPAQMKNYPAVEAKLTSDDSYTLYDELIARLVTSWSLPFPPSGWNAERRDETDIDVVNALDAATRPQMRRMQGFVPKSRTSANSANSATTSPAAVPVPPASTPEPSPTPPAS
jgi:hypothetical protein